MKKFAPYLLLPILVSIVAAIGIFENSARRMPHADESEQAQTFKKLETNGEYAYNPNGPHGPTLYYFALEVKKFFLQSENQNFSDASKENILKSKTREMEILRKSVFAFFILILLTYPLLQKPFSSALFGAMFFSISSLASIYSTYFVHEIIFAFFIFALSGVLWRFLKKPTMLGAALCGALAGLAQCTKETAPIFFLAMAIAGGTLYCLSKNLEKNRVWKKDFNWKKIKKFAPFFAYALFYFALVILVFYSSFFQNFKGVGDAFLSYFHFAEKAQSSAHSSPWHSYINLLTLKKSHGIWFGELPIFVLATLGILWAFFWKTKSYDKNFENKNYAKYNALIAIISIIIFSLIQYKTPWLMLVPMVFLCALAGSACDAMLSARKNIFYKLIILCALFVAAFFQFQLSQNASKKFHSDPRNPFIYAHTTTGIKRLINRVDDASKVSEYGKDIPVAILMLDHKTSPWPLPWYFDSLRNAGVWSSHLPENIEIFEVVILDMRAEFPDSLDKKNYVEEWGGLRENLGLVIYTKKNIFDEIIK